MPRRWTRIEENILRKELKELYVRQNKTIGEIAILLGLADQTVFQRLQRLGISSHPERKPTYIARLRSDVVLPKVYTPELAEFFGIMLGDGHLSYFQVIVTLGTKEQSYAEHVVRLITGLFGPTPKIGIRKNGFRDVYLGSRCLVEWLKRQGLVSNKVQAKVKSPAWIFEKSMYMRYFLRGLFDTDGSIYKLRFGIQISFTNKSGPLLQSAKEALDILGFHPSRISAHRVYVTKREEIERFFREVQPANPKHLARFKLFMGR